MVVIRVFVEILISIEIRRSIETERLFADFTRKRAEIEQIDLIFVLVVNSAS